MKLFIFLATAAFSYATDIITFNPGVVNIAVTEFIAKSDVIITGKNSSVIRLENKADCPMLFIGDVREHGNGWVENVLIQDLVLFGNRFKQNNIFCLKVPHLKNNCITLRNVKNSVIQNVTLFGGSFSGLYLENCKNIVITGLNVYDNGYDGITMLNCTNILFSELASHGNEKNGISFLTGTSNNKISNAIIDRNGNYSFYLENAKNNIIYNTTILNNIVFINIENNNVLLPSVDNMFINVNPVPITIGHPACTGNSFKFRQ